MPKSCCLTIAMISCSVSRSLLLMRTTSPWMEACAFFFEFLMSFTISRAFSIGIPCCRVFLCYGASGGWLERSVGQPCQRDAAFDQLLLEDVVHRLHLEFIGGVKHDRVRAFHRDLGLRVFQIGAGADFP